MLKLAKEDRETAFWIGLMAVMLLGAAGGFTSFVLQYRAFFSLIA